MLENISINCHSSIRIGGNVVFYFDPFRVDSEAHDASAIFFTHSHYDHFSPEDAARLANTGTLYVAPESMRGDLQKAGIPEDHTLFLKPGGSASVCGVSVTAISAYNTLKPFHPKHNGWLGYVAALPEYRVYVCGDTDVTPESRQVKCDVLLLPIGGTYTMDTKAAAMLTNALQPQFAIPTHYGCIVGHIEDAGQFRSLVGPGIQVVEKI